MKREEVRGGGEEERERSAHESQEVVVIVTVSLYLSISAISSISLLWGKKSTYQGQRVVSLRQNYQPTHMHNDTGTLSADRLIKLTP